MNWSQETPTQVGYYWFWRIKWSNYPTVVEVYKPTYWNDGRLEVRYIGSDEDTDIPGDSWWMGPLHIPEKPE